MIESNKIYYYSDGSRNFKILYFNSLKTHRLDYNYSTMTYCVLKKCKGFWQQVTKNYSTKSYIMKKFKNDYCKKDGVKQ